MKHVTLLASLVWLASSGASAQPLVSVEEADLVLPTRTPGDSFGLSVALSLDGMRAVVGSPGLDTFGANSGGARVYVRTGSAWALESDLVPTMPAVGHGFGGAVTISDDGGRIAVGRSGWDSPVGGDVEGGLVVFVRAGSTWMQEAVITGVGGSAFPTSLRMTADGTRIVASSPTYVTSWGIVAVYALTGTTWALERRIDVPVPAGGTYWGYGIAITADGSRLAASCPGDDAGPGGVNSGSVWVYARSGAAWTVEATLYASVADASEQLGNGADTLSFASDGSRLLVGHWQDAGPGGSSNRGSAVVWSRAGTTWTEEAVLLHPMGRTSDSLGYAVSLSADGSRALVGAPLRTESLGGEGTIELFDRVGTTWSHAGSFTATTPGLAAAYGDSLDLSGDGTRAVVGAPTEGVSGVGSNMGSARTIRFERHDPNGTACTDAGSCASGSCVDGVCCDTACGGGATDDCQACSVAAGASADGTCGAVTAAAALSCRPASCASGTATAAATCDGTATSCPAAATMACDPYVCDVAACRTSCDLDAHCAAGRRCVAHACVAPSDAGLDAASSADAATARDAGADATVGVDAAGTTVSAGGCACTAPSGASSRGPGLLALAMAIGIVVSRRRARRGGREPRRP